MLKKDKNLNSKHLKRIEELINAFQNQKTFVINGSLACVGACELPKDFYTSSRYDGVCGAEREQRMRGWSGHRPGRYARFRAGAARGLHGRDH